MSNTTNQFTRNEQLFSDAWQMIFSDEYLASKKFRSIAGIPFYCKMIHNALLIDFVKAGIYDKAFFSKEEIKNVFSLLISGNFELLYNFIDFLREEGYRDDVQNYLSVVLFTIKKEFYEESEAFLTDAEPEADVNEAIADVEIENAEAEMSQNEISEHCDKVFTSHFEGAGNLIKVCLTKRYQNDIKRLPERI